ATFRHLDANTARLGGGRVHAILAEAPECLASLPDPDAVFVGGSGCRLGEILEASVERLRAGGRVVLKCLTLESFSPGWDVLQKLGLEVETTSIQLSHTRPLGRWHSLQPESPIFILRGKKP